jgi:hypothetical protein
MAENNNKMVANAVFEKEKNTGLSMDQLSYICDYCGKVNQIGSPRCVRCGKRRPRSEYINAMNKIKSTKNIKAEYLEEQFKVDVEKKDAAQQQIVRLVESRVEDEKRGIVAQENLRVEQEREAIKKSTARDAVLRIIATEKAAEDKIKEAELRADEAIKGRNKELDGIVEDERKKVLEVAAQKVVAARAGIEEAAREQIEANKNIASKFVANTVAEERDKAEKNAARRAVLQIIAAEKEADDKVKSTKDALQQAAVERIVEERILADKEAAARYLAEKQAIERAADERIKSEKETLKKLLEEKQGMGMSQYNPYSSQSMSMPQQTVQPFAIVPYLNPQQPVYQYKPNQVFKFVPNNTNNANIQSQSNKICGLPSVENNKKTKAKKSKVRVCSFVNLVIVVILLLLGTVLGKILPIISGVNNFDLLESLFFKFNVSLNVGAVQDISMIVLIGYGLFLIFLAVALFQNIIKLISGKSAKLGFIIPLLVFISLAVILVGLLTVNGVLAIMTLGPILYTVLALLLLVLTIISGVNKKAKE